MPCSDLCKHWAHKVCIQAAKKFIHIKQKVNKTKKRCDRCVTQAGTESLVLNIPLVSDSPVADTDCAGHPALGLSCL